MNNNFIFIGRICKDLELRYTKENKAVCEVKIAIQNGKDDTTFVPITTFGKTAENICEYATKGDLIGFQGILKNHNWEDQNGNKHYDYTFMANRMSFLQSKSNRNEVKSTDFEKKDNTDIFAEFGNSIEISDDDICF